jgi:hypothetical protein
VDDLLVRFFLGGIVVSMFAALGDALRPRTFAGIFGAAPSVALASLFLRTAPTGPRTSPPKGALAHQGRRAEALDVFERAEGLASDLGMFAEQYDPQTGRLLGNVPQGLSHHSHISAPAALGYVQNPTRH